MFDDDIGSGSIFPFLSVMFCTLGALLIIMIVGSTRTSIGDKSLPDKIARAEKATLALAEVWKTVEKTGELRSNAEEEKAGLDQMHSIVSRAASDVSAASAGLAEIRAAGQAAEARITKVGLARKRHSALIARKDASARQQAKSEDVDSVRRRIEELAERLTAFTGERDGLKSRMGTPEAVFRHRDDGSGRRPVYVEIRKDSLVVHSDGTSVPPGTQVGSGEAISSVVDGLAAELARPDSDRYAVLLVRPGAVDLYVETTDKLRKRRASYLSEPVEASWRLVFR